MKFTEIFSVCIWVKLCCSETHFVDHLRCFEYLLLLDNNLAQSLMYSEVFLLGSVVLLVCVCFCHLISATEMRIGEATSGDGS